MRKLQQKQLQKKTTKKEGRHNKLLRLADLPGVEPGLKAPEAFVISSYTTDP